MFKSQDETKLFWGTIINKNVANSEIAMKRLCALDDNLMLRSSHRPQNWASTLQKGGNSFLMVGGLDG